MNFPHVQQANALLPHLATPLPLRLLYIRVCPIAPVTDRTHVIVPTRLLESTKPTTGTLIPWGHRGRIQHVLDGASNVTRPRTVEHVYKP